MSAFLIPSTLVEELKRMLNLFWWGNSVDPSKGVKWTCWDDLCVHKNHGGLIFHNLNIFNMAMLGKVGWKCFSNLNALITRIFKAKYFHRGNFLNVGVGHSPSYAWRSI
ncbi:hypothetical protein ACS0TY_025087 [Phlomoides rotata]